MVFLLVLIGARYRGSIDIFKKILKYKVHLINKCDCFQAEMYHFFDRKSKILSKMVKIGWFNSWNELAIQ